jgi:hypothetical protein
MTDDDRSADDESRRLARLEDLDAIRALKMRYARYCDAGYDAPGIASLFVPHGVWDGGPLFGRAEGVDAIRAHFEAAPQRIPWSLHYILAPIIEVAEDGRSATGSWYLWQPCVRRSSKGEDRQAWLAGTYADRYAKVDGRWLFEYVTVEARWLDGPPPSPPPA